MALETPLQITPASKAPSASSAATSVGEVNASCTRAGVGYSENPQSRHAGIEAATAALRQAGVESCQLVLLFSTAKHDPVQLHQGVRAAVGPQARIFGGHGAGIITNDRLGYEGHQVGVAVIASPSLRVEMFIEKGLPGNEYGVGVALGRQVREAASHGDASLLLMYDIVRQGVTGAGMSMNMATPLLAGMTEAMGTWPPTAGGGMVGGMSWNPGFQWFDDRVEQQSAMALVLSGGVHLDTIVIHGCQPSSGYHTITRADYNTVLELDGRPALDVVTGLMPDTEHSIEEYPLFVTLGVNNGDKFGPYLEDDYAIRLCMAVDTARRGLVMFGDDLQEGVEVQLMRRSIDFGYVADRTRQLLARVKDRRPLFAFYVDCAGRQSPMCGSERDEAEEVQKAIGESIPLLGTYVGCEIARAGNVMQSHNWTGVLNIFSE